MKTRRIIFGLLLLSTLGCSFVTQIVLPPTPTPTPAASLTATASQTSTPTLQPLQPAYVPPECAAVPLATIPPGQDVQDGQPTEVGEISQGQQLSIFEELADLVEDFYVYRDYNGRDWEEIESSYREEVKDGLDTAAFYDEMSALIEELGDEHSAFLSPVEVARWDAELRGEVEFVGIGIDSLADFERERLIVVSTYPGSPAEHAGIQHHDSILQVDGRSIDADLGDLLRGPACSAVVLTVQSPGEAPREVMLIRAAIHGNVPIYTRHVPTEDGAKIGYIFIPSFFDETLPQQIESALNAFGPLDGLILDVRVNAGGSSSVAYPILEFFIAGRLGDFISRSESRPLEIDANEIQNSQTVPLIVMVSEDTVSFGELFAGVLQDAGRARVVGQTTLGNVEVLNGFRFEDGSQLWLATETFVSAFSEGDWEETGIVPDVQAFAEWDTFYFETDPSIAAAVDLLGH